MKKIMGLAGFIALLTLPAMAQNPTFEVGGGYTYRSFNAQPFNAPDSGLTFITEPRMAMNGWNATFDANISRWFGVVTDFDWTTTNAPHDLAQPGKNTFSTLMIGPQIYPIGHHRLTPFAHFEVGLAHFKEDFSSVLTCGITGTGASAVNNGPCVLTDGSFAFDFGGGLDVSFNRHLAIRLAEFDYDQSRMFGGEVNGNSNQNNYKLKAGVIVRFGEH